MIGRVWGWFYFFYSINKLSNFTAFHIPNTLTQSTNALPQQTDDYLNSTEAESLFSNALGPTTPTPSCCDNKYTYDLSTGELTGIYILAMEGEADWDCSENCIYVK